MKMKSTQVSVPREKMSRLKASLFGEAVEVPIGVGSLKVYPYKDGVGESVSCTLRIRVPVIAGIWVVPRAFVPFDEGSFFVT